MNRAFVLAGEQRSAQTRVEDKGVSKSYSQTGRMAGGSMDYQEKGDAFFDLYQPIYTHFHYTVAFDSVSEAIYIRRQSLGLKT